MSNKELIKIVLGVIICEGKVLLSQRQAGQTFSGLWEFPGGKVETGESISKALDREILEEIGLKPENCQWRPLINFNWKYAKQTLNFSVFITEGIQYKNKFGNKGSEGQNLKWHLINKLNISQFPAANEGIIQAIQLPELYMITGGFNDELDALKRLGIALNSGIKLCQLRANHLSKIEFISLATKAVELCHQHGAKILLNSPISWFEQIEEADGIQLSFAYSKTFNNRPVALEKLLAISTHNSIEIQHALRLKPNFLLLSNVKETKSHPGIKGIGWKQFYAEVSNISIPVYALGGMQKQDVTKSYKFGGQGIAAISELWIN